MSGDAPVRRPSSTGAGGLLPRLGFVGVGWIGRHRLQAVVEAGSAVVAAVSDPSAEARAQAVALAPDAASCEDLASLLDRDLDGVVIATPSAQHAEQAVAAFERGLAVFCQKPLARTADETRAVLDAARRADRLLGVDFSYRHARALQEVAALVHSGALGTVFALDLVFHNAYGPDKAWFYDVRLSGGGCLMDLGIHLVDAAIWLGGPVRQTAARLFAAGRPLTVAEEICEDYAALRLDFASGATATIQCSWRLAAGRDAIISVAAYGTRGGARCRNVDGTFYDFVAERYEGTRTEPIVGPPDAWGGRAIVAWTRVLAASGAFDAEAERLIDIAAVLDEAYGRRRA